MEVEMVSLMVMRVEELVSKHHLPLDGNFGKGKNGEYIRVEYTLTVDTWTGSGGGGYYGGACGSGTYAYYTGRPGFGGSSFISGYSGCNAVKSQTDPTPSGSSIHYSGYVFENMSMQSGVRSGNGLVIITQII